LKRVRFIWLSTFEITYRKAFLSFFHFNLPLFLVRHVPPQKALACGVVTVLFALPPPFCLEKVVQVLPWELSNPEAQAASVFPFLSDLDRMNPVFAFSVLLRLFQIHKTVPSSRSSVRF